MPLRGNYPRVGILGGGQLARMLALGGWPLGVRFLQLTPDDEAARGIVETVHADYDDMDAQRDFAARVDVVTFEFENVPVATAEFLATLVPVRPSPRALATAADRWAEKVTFQRLGIPSAPFVTVGSAADLERALADVGLPAVVKTRRLGYDGRGQLVCRTADELRSAFDRLGGVPLLCERWIPFQREISVVGVRAADGGIRCYPPAENVHENGVLRSCIVPAPDLAPELAAAAAGHVRRIMDDTDYVGVMALEMFQHGDTLLANEMAPRVHNTGHWTIEGAATSQFENHVRAILGWPLGSTHHYGHAVMLNILGETPPLPALLAVPDAHVHAYGKLPRAGRKIGHVTALVESAEAGRRRLAELRAILGADA